MYWNVMELGCNSVIWFQICTSVCNFCPDNENRIFSFLLSHALLPWNANKSYGVLKTKNHINLLSYIHPMPPLALLSKQLFACKG